VGHIGLSLRPWGVADLGMLVAAGWRGQGVGAALMRSGLDWAREAGAHKIALQVWPHNEAALALYRKFGFVEEGRLRRHYRRRDGELWDAVLMGLLLDEPALRGV
ncbi:MAG: GNAT family N-acetyltransferase, partial [Acidimicrobiales bacterium]